MNIDYSALADDYARYRRAMPEVVKNLIEWGELSSTSKVLDVGCGTGNYAVALAQATGCSCWGIDPSEEMLAKARERAPAIRWKTGRAEALDFPKDFFNLVFSVDVIHYVRDRAAYFRGVRNVLKEGGHLCTATDSAEIIRRRKPLSVYFPETVEIELRRYPRICELRAQMSKAGYCNLREAEVEGEYWTTDIHCYRDKAFSSLHLITEEDFRRGLRRMEKDLRIGPIRAEPRYLLLWGARVKE
jgi:ubiquinone/menaquinone biosynthesis C-methylase UbiE